MAKEMSSIKMLCICRNHSLVGKTSAAWLVESKWFPWYLSVQNGVLGRQKYVYHRPIVIWEI